MLDTDENRDLDDRLSPAHKSGGVDSDKFDELIEQGFSPEEAKAMEMRAIDGAIDDMSTPQDKAEKDKLDSQSPIDSFYKQESEKNEGKGKVKGFVSRNRGKIGIGTLLLGGGGFALFGMIAGPLQFMQIAKLLQGFHFANQEDLSDDRMVKIARYIRYRDKPEKTRLGILGNAYADRLERRMNESGIESSYTDRLGYEDGYIIDPDRLPPGSELADDIGGSTAAEIETKLATHYDVPTGNIDTTKYPGKVWVSSDGLGHFGKKKLTYRVMRDSGMSKIGSAMRTRIMGRRGGVDWHPIKKLDRKVLTTLDARLKKWTGDRENKIRNGTTDNPDLIPEDSVDSDNDNKADSPSENDVSATSEANNIDTTGDVTPGTSAADAKVNSVRSKLGKTAGVSMIVGTLCLAKSLADNIDDIKQANVVLPLMRLGVEGMSVGNQIITGQDVDGEQLGFLANKLYSDADGSWASARSIQAELGKEQTGPDIGPEASISSEKNALAQALDIPGLGGVCTVVNSAFGQVVSFALDVFTGPASAFAGAAFSEVLGPKLFDAFTRWIAGHPIDVNVAGANYGNYINYGAKLAANDSYISSGGTKLDDAQSLELKQLRIASDVEARQDRGLLARLFDPTDATSIVGGFMSEQAPDPAKNIARAASSVPSSFASIFKLPLNLGQNKAKAASNYDYGFSDYGYSIDDINREEVKNPFENAKEVVSLLEGPEGDDYRERTEKCFGIKLQSDGAVRSTGQVPKYKDIDDSDNNCEDKSLGWLRIRFYILDSQLMEAYACYENDTEACQEFGLDGSGESTGDTSRSPTYVDPALYNIPDCSANGGRAEIACVAISELTGIEYIPLIPGTQKRDFSKRPSADNPNPQYAECSSFTNMALYRAFGYYTNQSSVYYRSNPNFIEIDVRSIKTGDFLGRGSVAGSAGGNGHIGIVVSYDPETKELITVEADGSAHPSRVVTNKGLKVDGKGTYEWAVRYVGPGAEESVNTGGPR